MTNPITAADLDEILSAWSHGFADSGAIHTALQRCKATIEALEATIVDKQDAIIGFCARNTKDTIRIDQLEAEVAALTAQLAETQLAEQASHCVAVKANEQLAERDRQLREAIEAAHKIQQLYNFECGAGPLKNCLEWRNLITTLAMPTGPQEPT